MPDWLQVAAATAAAFAAVATALGLATTPMTAMAEYGTEA